MITSASTTSALSSTGVDARDRGRPRHAELERLDQRVGAERDERGDEEDGDRARDARREQQRRNHHDHDRDDDQARRSTEDVIAPWSAFAAR
jgi:hypothetical protein